MADFDAYLMVDWSASSRPKTGKDSIWYCQSRRRPVRDQAELDKPQNPPTRYDAYEKIRKILIENAAEGVRTLVGFDFPYGYPTSFAALVGLKSDKPWRAVWDFLARDVRDNDRNENNRGEVAAGLNKLISEDCFPFWGNGLNQEIPNLCKKKTHCSTERHALWAMNEKRIVEERCRAHSAFKLSGAGSVGSQALLGIPYVKKLRDDPQLSDISGVWPFETGFTTPASWAKQELMVVHAEIYPSIKKTFPEPEEVKDCAQVKALAQYFAEEDQCCLLGDLFAGPPDLTPEQREIIEGEEGWILGVSCEASQSKAGD